MPDHRHPNLRELEELCAAAAHSQLSEKESSRLEQLLLDHPKLQEVYCRNVSLSTLLRAEFGLGGQAFTSLVPDVRNQPRDSDESPGCVALARHIRSDVGAQPFGNFRRRTTVGMLAVATAIVIALTSLGAWTHLRKGGIWGPTPALSPSFQIVESGPSARGGVSLELTTMELRSPKAIGLLHRVTNTTWNGDRAANSADANMTLDRVGQGAAQLARFNGQLAGGHVIALPPGASLDLMVDADSAGENALAVMELNPRGVPTGGLVSFSNQGPGNTNSEEPKGGLESRVYGRLGNWSENNDGNTTKYFLLTGVHKQAPEVDDHSWYVTDYVVLVDEPDLIFIGWDDSGWKLPGAPKALRDLDYNDVTAAIRIRRPNATPRPGGDVRVIPRLDTEQEKRQPIDVDAGYAFDVAPGSGVVLGFASEAGSPNSVAVVHRATGRVWWQRNNVIRKDQHLGVCVVENHGLQPLEFLLVGKHQLVSATTAAYGWRPSRYKVVREGARCKIVGFEDSGTLIREQDDDWNDIQVALHWMPL